ncbi:MAG TPA: TIGR03619 family F420-dependent LLM class oxidoreductase [Acidimicrobiia bacterium]|jgi:probable F420-dependent oxidoreductase|nr:TIGR03619 family F420-dependent LLM class oxidoreductase [Acidimicrobiia bacterium]
MKFGVALGRLNPAFFVSATEAADGLGYESVWLPEHLVFTAAMSRSPHPGATHPPVPPETPIFDAFAYLSFLAARTAHVRLGTHVYNIGLRHPFVAARAVQTLDIVSGGRVEFGVGASWLEEEWIAAELDFTTRGKRVDEAIEICRLLWREPVATFHGEHFSFDGVVFEPKPVQAGGPPIVVGGESRAALRRAARLGDGWIGMGHTVESAGAQIEILKRELDAQGRAFEGFQVCLGGPLESADDVERWESIGVTRMLVSPWRRSPEALDGLASFATRFGLASSP